MKNIYLNSDDWDIWLATPPLPLLYGYSDDGDQYARDEAEYQQHVHRQAAKYQQYVYLLRAGQDDENAREAVEHHHIVLWLDAGAVAEAEAVEVRLAEEAVAEAEAVEVRLAEEAEAADKARRCVFPIIF